MTHASTHGYERLNDLIASYASSFDIMAKEFSVDITFEGPEHGGIRSTAFSARVVQDACNETGLPPERTPAVQVLMVLIDVRFSGQLNFMYKPIH